MTYEFALIVDREPTETELQSLDEAEIESAGIVAFETDGGRVLAHIVVEADTLPAAIAQGIKRVELLGGFNLRVLGIASDDLVSLRDIAERTRRSYESVRLLATGSRGPGGFPMPFSTGQWNLYSWAEVAEWFARHYASDAPVAYARQMAAADLVIRARRMIDDDERSQLATLLTA